MAPIKNMSAALRALLTGTRLRKALPASWVSRLSMEPIEAAFWDAIGQASVLRWVDDQGNYWLAVHRWGARLSVSGPLTEAGWNCDAP